MRLPLPPSVNHDGRYDADSRHILRSKVGRAYRTLVAQYVTYELCLNGRIHPTGGWALPSRCGSPTAGGSTWTTTSRGFLTPCRLPLPSFRPPVLGSHRQSPRCGFVRLCRTVQTSCVPDSGRGSHGVWSARGGGAIRQRPGGSVGREGKPWPGKVGNMPWNVGNDRGRSQGSAGSRWGRPGTNAGGEVNTYP